MAVGAVLALPAVASATPPNVLVIVADDMGVDKVGAYADDFPGYRDDASFLPVTTTIDELAASGLRFSAAWSNPLCSPTRASLLTGRHPFRTSVGTTIPNGEELDPDAETTLADILTDPSAGPEPYSAALVGKWHLGYTGASGTYSWSIPGSADHRDVNDISHPLRAGFQEFRGTLRGYIDDYDDWERIIDKERGQAAVDEVYVYSTDIETDDAIDWINEQEGPWYLQLAYHTPHTADDSGHYKYSDVPDSCHSVSCVKRGNCSDAAPAVMAAMVECMDNSIATLLTSLPEDTLDNTLIVFLGDNGTFDTALEGDFNDAGSRSDNGKGTSYQSGVAVPLVVADGRNWREWHACSDTERDAGTCALTDGLILEPGRTVTSPVHTTDTFATVVDFADFVQSTGVDSSSFYPCFTDASATCATPSTGDRYLYTEAWDYSGSANGGSDGTVLSTVNAAMRHGDAKLVVTYSSSRRCFQRELYDLSTDPFEWTNLASDASWASTLSDLSTAMRTTLAPTWMSGKTWCS